MYANNLLDGFLYCTKKFKRGIMYNNHSISNIHSTVILKFTYKKSKKLHVIGVYVRK